MDWTSQKKKLNDEIFISFVRFAAFSVTERLPLHRLSQPHQDPMIQPPFLSTGMANECKLGESKIFTQT